MRKDIEAIYPLTPTQEGMLFHSLYAPRSGTYIQQMHGTLCGDLDLAAFRTAWQRVIQRHTSLRTAFVWEGLDEPRQVVGRNVTMPIELVDLSSLPERQRTQQIDQFLEADRLTDFKLARAPLMRLTLFKLEQLTHRFVWTHHHILADGWSVAILLNEVFQLYELGRRNLDLRLPHCRPYADYVSWWKRQDLEQAKAYWRTLLRDFSTPHVITTPAAQKIDTTSDEHLSIEKELDQSTTSALQHLAREHRLTLNTIVQGAWVLVLGQHGRTQDVVFGAVSSGRPPEIPGIDSIVGLFINTLPVRVRIDPDRPVHEWLRDLQTQQVEQRQYEHTPLTQVHKCSDLPSSVPLFDTLLIFESYPISDARTEDASLHLSGLTSVERTNYPVNLHVLGSERLTLRFRYDGNRCATHVVSAMLEQLEHALRQMAGTLSMRVGEITLLRPLEQTQILKVWNATERNYEVDVTLHELIVRQLNVSPDSIAVETEHSALSRGELDRASNRLANYLISQGVGPERPVGICMERSTELMVALLATLKAGAPYVPLDPDFPRERIRHMHDDSGVCIVLTQQRLIERLRPDGDVHWIPLDSLSKEIDIQANELAKQAHLPEAPAYVIYTSGSTGRPKGAANSHRGICNRLLWMQEQYRLTDADRVLQKTPISFDVSVWELFWPLLAGARLVMARPGGHRDPSYLAATIERFGITTLHFVPSMLNLFLEEIDLERRCRSLKRVICSGEALPWTTRERFVQRLAAELHNLYGPTEAAVDVSSWDCRQNRWPGMIPIGAPIANTRLLILDRQDRLLPQGSAGELHIGGVQVGMGYWQQPRLTAERFTPDPFASSPGDRLYRTGDLARWLPDGNIEFIGRNDEQIKIRGVRIEPSEVEHHLCEHPQVREAAVRLWKDPSGEAHLAAYVVPELDRDEPEETFDYERPAPDDDGSLVRAVTRFLRGAPKRVLQIGGRITQAREDYASKSECYCVFESAPLSISSLHREITDCAPTARAQIELREQDPDDIGNLPAAAFDLIIIDDVAHRFCGVAQLLKMVEAAARCASEGGLIYLSGLLNLQLQTPTLILDEIERSNGDANLQELSARARYRAQHDDRLWVDPTIFTLLRRRIPRLARIALDLPTDVEASIQRARYDVAIAIQSSAREAIPHMTVDMTEANLEALRVNLQRERPAAILLQACPNANAAALLHTAQAIEERSELQTVAQLRSFLARRSGEQPARVEDYRQLASSLGYELELSVSARPDRVDIWLLQPQVSASAAPVGLAQRDLREYANDPLWTRRARHLAPTLRRFLEERLPTWLVPAHILPIRQMPLTPSGKADYRALPPAVTDSPPVEPRYVAPRTPQEALLADIWSEVLGVKRVGVLDNFFALGGDSIRAIRVQSKARKQGLSFALQTLFAMPDIARLANRLEPAEQANANLEAHIAERFSLVSTDDRKLLDDALEDAYPLTRMQAGMLFHSELAPETSAYHDVFTSHLRAPLAPHALQHAVRDLVDRHPVLRTSFELVRYSEPLQLVNRDGQVTVEFDNWRHLDANECEARIRNWLAVERRRRFDWRNPGLVRFHVHARTPESFQFTVSFHHSILDGWSVAVMISELFQLYQRHRGAERAAEVPPAVSNAMKQLVALEGQAVLSTESRDFWQAQLEHHGLTRLPRSPGYVGPRQVRVHSIELSDELSSKLAALAQSLGVPLRTVLLAAYARVLSAATGVNTVVTGLIGSSRPETADSDRALGLFINNLPFVLDTRDASWTGLIHRTYQHELSMHAHRRYPMAELHRAAHGGALFETAFNFVHFHAYEVMQGVSDIEYLGGEFAQETDLTLLVNFHLDIASTSLRIALDYDTGQLTDDYVRRFAERLRLALAQLVASPASGHGDLPLLSDAELAEFRAWNDTTRDIGTPHLVHRRFEQQARLSPEAIALEFENERITYATLERRADTVAQGLLARGVSVEDRVAVCLERSVDLVVALLGVLKTGAAYVPLDPDHPADRLAHVLKDSAPAIVISDRGTRDRLAPLSVNAICLDELRPSSHGAVSPSVHGSGLAYIIYTSGSTGRPKGVMVSHRAICNLLDSMKERPGLRTQDVLVSVTTIAFDIAALELFLPLTTGARVVLASREVASDPNRLSELMADVGATAMQATPTTWRMLLNNRWAGQRDLTVLCGGEAFPQELRAQLLDRCAAVWNMYGPTETTIWSAVKHVIRDSGPVPIGSPIANTQMHILGGALQVLPVGASGELYIAGEGLARGYWRQARLTAERFVPDPFSDRPGSRMYRTGDLAKRLDTGDIEVLGRTDFQIKLHGFRIELGEIEAAMLEFPGVRGSVVALRHSPTQEPALVAGIVCNDGLRIDLAALREFLETRLPDYMLPSAYTILSALPLQPNGKLDRHAALKLLDDAKPVARAPYVAPKTSAERLVAAIWSHVLRTDRIGVRDSFFELGGHSLNAMQVLGRLRETFQIDLQLAQIFEDPSVQGVVAALGEQWGSQEIVEEIARTVLEVRSLSIDQLERSLDEGDELASAVAME